MRRYTLVLCGGRGHAPQRKLEKNGAIWCILSIRKYAIIILKINNFKDYKSTTKILFAIFFSPTNWYVHVNKLWHYIRGVWMAAPNKPKIFLKNQTKNTWIFKLPPLQWAKSSIICSLLRFYSVFLFFEASLQSSRVKYVSLWRNISPKSCSMEHKP